MGGTDAQLLNSKLSADETLDELTLTPFVLSEVITIFNSGREIPRTRLGLIGAVVALMEQSDEHQSQLQTTPLWDRAGDYLSALANHLVAPGEVTLTDSDARRICHVVTEYLQEMRQISSAPEPADILNALCGHHILERVDYPEISFRFEHQQFQEYYSALILRTKLKDLLLPGSEEKQNSFARIYINEPAWDEPLRMIAEAIGSGEPNTNVMSDTLCGELLVRFALRVDPIFAADLARLCGSSVWHKVGAEISQRLRSWYHLPSEHHKRCALAAMIATGSDEFSDILLPILSNHDRQTRIPIHRLGVVFHTSSLGPDWRHVVLGWQEPARIAFIRDMTLHHGRADIALEFAHSDPSPVVRDEAIRDLAWVGRRDEVARLIRMRADQESSETIKKLDVEDIPISLRSKSISIHKELLRIETDAKACLALVMKLAALRDDDIPQQLKNELTMLPSTTVKELGEHFLWPALEIVREADPDWARDWATEKIVQGVVWGDKWLSIIPAIPDSLARQLLQRASLEHLEGGPNAQIIHLLAATATEQRAQAVFTNLCAHRLKPISGASDRKHQNNIDIQLTRLFLAIPSPVALGGLSELLTQEPESGELAVITEMFGGRNLGAPI